MAGTAPSMAAGISASGSGIILSKTLFLNKSYQSFEKNETKGVFRPLLADERTRAMCGNFSRNSGRSKVFKLAGPEPVNSVNRICHDAEAANEIKSHAS